ncbi:MAG: hypothetical protein ABH986_05010 [archaeon]
MKKAEPDFIEVKAYMFVGESRKRLKQENMPSHKEVKEFTKKLKKFLPKYEIVSEHKPSRVVMMAKKSFKKKGKWFTWIDFVKWNKLVQGKKKFASKDYLSPTK